jgi:hypothetical protein
MRKRRVTRNHMGSPAQVRVLLVSILIFFFLFGFLDRGDSRVIHFGGIVGLVLWGYDTVEREMLGFIFGLGLGSVWVAWCFFSLALNESGSCYNTRCKAVKCSKVAIIAFGLLASLPSEDNVILCRSNDLY